MDRLAEWREFSEMVEDHIRKYAEVQYKDNQAGAYTAADCMKNVERYTGRYGKLLRGEDEQIRDFKKVAHWACIALFRWIEGKR